MAQPKANPTAAMLVIGDEILSGRTRDANMHHLAGRLTAMGVDLKEVRVVSDEQNSIVDAVRSLAGNYTHVFTSGGIGPTHDDITADSVAAAFGAAIDIRHDAKVLLTAHYDRQGVALNAARLRMARIPDGANLIENPISAAPGFSLENVHVMAGVPAIFEAMLASLLPRLTGGRPLVSKSIRVDLPEGEIAGPLGDVAERFPNLSLGSYPFIQNGVFGANVVIRGNERSDVDAATQALQLAFGDKAQ
ncbi:MAG: molybdopterin-binding protein [Pseudomonadota bacterium]